MWVSPDRPTRYGNTDYLSISGSQQPQTGPPSISAPTSKGSKDGPANIQNIIPSIRCSEDQTFTTAITSPSPHAQLLPGLAQIVQPPTAPTWRYPAPRTPRPSSNPIPSIRPVTASSSLSSQATDQTAEDSEPVPLLPSPWIRYTTPSGASEC